MKRIGKKRQGDIEPDLTSFSDIANLLIIFFILTTTLARPWGRKVDMPSGLDLLGACRLKEGISFNACGSEGYVRDTELVPLALVMNVTSDGNDDFLAVVCAEVEVVGSIVTAGVLADTVVSASFDGNKIIFYFTADGRVDFRELVRDQAYVEIRERDY